MFNGKNSKRTKTPLIVGNWKMVGSRQQVDEFMALFIPSYQKLESLFSTKDIVICPAFPYLSQVYAYLKNTKVMLGGQDCFWAKEGAYTGEVSPYMLTDSNSKYVILGHSERRQLLGETNAVIARKFRAAYDASLSPILCVGETEAERQQGKTLEVVRHQLESVLEEVGVIAFERAILAYEPVWAIGTGLTATPQQAGEVHAFLRTLFKTKSLDLSNQVRILYGGSVKAGNAEQLFAEPDIDGALVGGASLNAEEFLTICRLIN
jgi:triosephosphate isomerase